MCVWGGGGAGMQRDETAGCQYLDDNGVTEAAAGLAQLKDTGNCHTHILSRSQ